MKTLTNEQIKDMLSEVIISLDYDIWKDVFLEDSENPEWAEDIIDQMSNIVKKHIED